MGPRNGRLHFQPSSGQYGAWAVATNNEFQYFEVNFGDWTKVTKVATQGRQDGAWWVKSYSLSYSYDGVFFEDYKEENEVKVFNFIILYNLSLNIFHFRTCRPEQPFIQSLFSLSLFYLINVKMNRQDNRK